MKSATQFNFATVPQANIPRSTFNRSHSSKLTFDSGLLIPILVDETLPGDTFSLRLSLFARLATPIHPILDNMQLETFFFAVPMRLIWSNWEKFCGSQVDPGDSIEFTIPEMTSAGGLSASSDFTSLRDYFGIQPLIDAVTHNSVFHRAYNLIWNEWFRDQNLQDSVIVDLDDGPDTEGDYVLLRRGKRADYFTSCLPWPQKGDAVTLPLGTSAPVDLTIAGTPSYRIDDVEYGVATNAGAYVAEGGSPGTDVGPFPYFDVAGLGFTATANLATATAATINAIRQAFQIQKMLERDARSGTRYVELIKSHFGVTSPDFRHQRPEYLGGGFQTINVQSIPTTSNAASGIVGTLGGVGTSTGSGHGFNKSFTEHCLIIGLCSVKADMTYSQGMNRMFSRQTRYDYFWPSLALIGEQSVLNQEIYQQGAGDPTADAATFGYQERYAEYKYKPSTLHGEFRHNHPISLDTWHLGQEFSSLPTLGSDFIEENPPIMRAIVTQSDPEFIMDCFFNYKCARPIPAYSTPGMIDRF